MTLGSSVRLDFGSTLDMLDLVQGVGDHMGRMAGLDEDGLHWLGVAIRESVINAVRHGNRDDQSKRVHVEFTRFKGKCAMMCACVAPRRARNSTNPS